MAFGSVSLSLGARRDIDFMGSEADDAERLEAIRILAGLAARTGRAHTVDPSCTEAKSAAVATLNTDPCKLHELSIHVEGLASPLRLLEAAESEAATRAYKAAGEQDPFGAKVWPCALIAAQRLLAEGVVGRSVLELGCGTGLASVAALLGGASVALATDRVIVNAMRSKASAQLNGCRLHVAEFDVTLAQPLPSPAQLGHHWHTDLQRHCDVASNSLALQRCFDYMVFSDVLYWPREAAAFGRRAAQAYAAGSTVIVVDPGRRREDFLRALEDELEHLGVVPFPVFDLVPVQLLDQKWISAEVKTASTLFCEQPFELILRQPSSGISGACMDLAAHLEVCEWPDYYEPVE
eukprot:TRINITY_DN26773_c0_g2_i1.p1 TRINITY_DN26773_c0_g2~~TRINITY_DN26773_c0_g2_i1.p1  ORF type:complete len:351 (+),score=55.09 TRINITY_DN26773_c0_g2_i1:89-1141(+)